MATRRAGPGGDVRVRVCFGGGEGRHKGSFGAQSGWGRFGVLGCSKLLQAKARFVLAGARPGQGFDGHYTTITSHDPLHAHPSPHSSHRRPTRSHTMSAPSLAPYIVKRPWLQKWIQPLSNWYCNAAGYRQLGLRYAAPLVRPNVPYMPSTKLSAVPGNVRWMR